MTAKPTSNVTVVLGAMTIGAPGHQAAMRINTHEGTTELLDVFRKHGHSEVDTSRMYGYGTAEDYLGAIGWQKRGIKMETKAYPTKGKNMGWRYPEVLSHSPTDLRKSLNDSLKALQTDKFYIFYLHGPSRSVRKIFEEGVFERFGLSNFMSWEVAWILPTVYQGPYNTIQRSIEAELIPCLPGFFTSRYTRDQTVFTGGERFDPDHKVGKMLRMRYWNDVNFKALDLLRAAVAPHGITESEAALRWLAHHSVLKKEFGDAVIVGAGSVKQLEENLEALDKGSLPADVVEALDAGWEREICSYHRGTERHRDFAGSDAGASTRVARPGKAPHKNPSRIHELRSS
ncbi:NADP-dependent oxidoreductase domain-containing protein [Mycena vulgaris]|nr:NADP-dependent oxidoreductase domain-containing protein [Mycena vulgaris]